MRFVMIKRNFTVWRREWALSSLQILLPLVFCLGVLIFKNQNGKSIESSFDTDLVSLQGLQCFDNNQFFAIIQTDDVPDIVKFTKEKLMDQKIKVKEFDSEDSFNLYVKDYPSVCGSLNFYYESLSQTLKYEIRLNSSSIDRHFSFRNLYQQDVYSGIDVAYKYVQSSFISLQIMVENYLNFRANRSILQFKAEIVYPMNDFSDHQFFSTYWEYLLPLNIKFPFICAFLTFIYLYVSDKEKFISKCFIVSGLTQTNYLMSWVACYSMIFLFLAFLESAILKLIVNQQFFSLFSHLKILFFFVLFFQIFKKVNYGILLVWIFLLGVNLTLTAVLVALPIKSTRMAILAGLMVFILINLVENFFTEESQDFVKYLVSISPLASFSMTGMSIAHLQYMGIGVDSLETFTHEYNRYSIAHGFISMTLVALLQILIIIPMKKYLQKDVDLRLNKLNSKQKSPTIIKQTDPLIEKKSSKLKATTFIEEEVQKDSLQVTKQSIILQQINSTTDIKEETVKIIDISMIIKQNQILTIIGQHGAGQNLLLQIISGFFKPEEGIVKYFGQDVINLSEIGYVFSHQNFNDKLTVFEIMNLFANLKSSPKSQISHDILKIIADVYLVRKQINIKEQQFLLTFKFCTRKQSNKKEVYYKDLEFYQKKLLSIGVALLGNPQLIILEEPTKRLDLFGQKFIWDILKIIKENRIVVITSHSIEEAEFVSDKIAILSQGQLVCFGSSSFLKMIYGAGYYLYIKFDDERQMNETVQDKILNETLKFQNQFDLLKRSQKEIIFLIKNEDIGDFKPFLKFLDKIKQSQINLNYEIQMTTLEQVYQRASYFRTFSEKQIFSLISEEENQNQLYKQSVFSPPPLVQNDDILQKGNNAVLDIDHKKQAEQYQYLEELQKRQIFGNRIKQLTDIVLPNGIARGFMLFQCLLLKRFSVFQNNRLRRLMKIILPLLIIILGFLILAQYKSPGNSQKLISESLYPLSSDFQFLFNSLDTSDLDFDFSLDRSQYIKVGSFDSVSALQQKIIQEDLPGGAWLESDATKNSISHVHILANAKYFDSLPILINLLSNLHMNSPKLKNSNKIPAEFSQKIVKNSALTLNPIPFTNVELSTLANQYSLTSFSYISIGFALISSSIIKYLVMTREIESQNYQKTLGLSIFPYWMSILIIDMSQLIVPGVAALITIQSLQIREFQQNDNFYPFLVLVFIYFYGVAPFSYLFSFLFYQSIHAQIFFYIFQIICGTIFPIIIYFLKQSADSAQAGIILQWIFRIFPIFSLGNGILNVITRREYFNNTEQSLDFQLYNMGDILAILCIGSFYFLIVLFYEAFKPQNACFNRENHQFLVGNMDEDVGKEYDQISNNGSPLDYKIFIKNVKKIFIGTKHSADLCNSTKRIMFQSLNLGIKQGEIFVLFGPNSSGKSTLLNMIANLIYPSKGLIYLNCINVRQYSQLAIPQFGYCWQSDILYNNMTVFDHLDFYSSLQGIASFHALECIQQVIQDLQLVPDQQKLVKNLSRGQRKRLALGIAMLGNPRILLLDEPCRDIDPDSQFIICRAINKYMTQNLNQSSVILTTNSSYECQLLATRMSVLSEGQLKCLGQVDYIKRKFGHDYELIFQIDLVKPQEVQQKINDIKRQDFQASTIIKRENLKNVLEILECPSIINESMIKKSIYAQTLIFQSENNFLSVSLLTQFILNESRGLRVIDELDRNFGSLELLDHYEGTYQVRFRDERISIALIFQFIQDNKELLKIREFSLSPTPVQEIFDRLVKQKIQRENQTNMIYSLNQIPMVMSHQPETPFPRRPIEALDMNRNLTFLGDMKNSQRIKLDVSQKSDEIYGQNAQKASDQI